MNSARTPRVTTCVVAHDEERLIERCLEALFRQEFAEPFDILLVDNASQDGTVSIAERTAIRLTRERPDLRFAVVKRKTNNLGAARQTALESTGTPLVAFTDADCVVPATWLASMVDAYESNRENGVVAVGTANQPPADGSHFHQAQRLMFETRLGHFGSEQARKTSTPVRDVTHLPTCSVLYDRTELAAVGGFNGTHRLVCEDVDLSYRLRARDARLLKIDSIEVAHHCRSSYRSWARKIFRYGWGQVQVMRVTREHRKWKFALPVIFALSFPVASMFGALDRWVVLYAVSILLVSLALCLRSRRLDLVAHMVPLFFVTHFSYGAGLLAGAAGWSGGRRIRG